MQVVLIGIWRAIFLNSEIRNGQSLRGQYIIINPVIFFGQYQIVRMEQKLTQDAVLLLSGNYDGPVVMQVYNVRKTPNADELFLCLTDGRVTTGAKFKSTENIVLNNYWLVQITAQFIAHDKPILIETLQVVSTEPKRLLGESPISLSHHFERERKKQMNIGFQRELPTKKIKILEPQTYISQPITNLSAPLNSNHTNGHHSYSPMKPVKSNNIPSIDLRSELPVYPSQKGAKKKNQRKLIIQQQQDHSLSPNSNTGRIKIEEIKAEQRPLMKTYIKDLTADLTNWLLFCKVTYVYQVECNRGTTALNFIMMDQLSDQVQCVCYGETAEKYQEFIQRGRYYHFSGGQVSGDKKPDGTKGKREDLQITFDRSARIIAQSDGHFSFDLSRINRIDQLLHKPNNEQINVLGIVRRVKPGEKQSNKNKLRYSVTICDPLSNYELQLGLFIGKDEDQIKVGHVSVIHNFKIDKKGNIVRLQSGFRSYYTEGQQIKGHLLQSFQKYVTKGNWNHNNYQSLSTLVQTRRTIKELTQALYHSQDPKLHSTVDCWIIQITEKNSYLACNSCKRSTQISTSGAYCSKCGANVETFLCYTFSVSCADYTSGLRFDVIGEHALSLIEMKAEQYQKLTKQEKKLHLESLRHKNVQIKFKSQAKKDKGYQGFSHSVWGIQKPDVRGTLKQIELLRREQRIFNDSW